MSNIGLMVSDIDKFGKQCLVVTNRILKLIFDSSDRYMKDTNTYNHSDDFWTSSSKPIGIE